MQSFPAPLQYFPRKVLRLNGSQNWFSGNPAPAISHFENPVTAEGIYWEGLWCEWKHGHYWKAWGASAATAFFLTHLSPPSLQNPINALTKVSNAVFWFMQMKNKNTYSTTDFSSLCYSLVMPNLVFACFSFVLVYHIFNCIFLSSKQCLIQSNSKIIDYSCPFFLYLSVILTNNPQAKHETLQYINWPLDVAYTRPQMTTDSQDRHREFNTFSPFCWWWWHT